MSIDLLRSALLGTIILLSCDDAGPGPAATTEDGRPSSSSTSGPPDETNSSGAGPEATSTGTPTGSISSGDTSSTATRGTPEPLIELGTGPLQWQPLEDGDEVELVAGLQGGWHVDVTLRVSGFAPDGTTLRYEAFDAATGGTVSHATFASLTSDNVVPTEHGWDRVGDRVVFDIEAAEAVVGATVCLVVEVHGPTFDGEDERCVTVVDARP